MSEDYLSIETPENVAFGYEVAGIGSRFLAGFVDTTLIVVLEVIVMVVGLQLASELDLGSEAAFYWLLAAFGLIAFGIFWGYYIFFEVIWNGQSPGKRLVGLRVVRADGTPIGLTESIIRNLVRLVDFLPAYYGLGVVTMFVNRQSRRLGDLAAGTVVVRDRGRVTLESLSAPAATPEIGARASSAWPVEKLSEQDVELAEDFLRRRDQLANRAALAREIAAALLRRMGLPEQAPLEDGRSEAVLLEIVRSRRQPQAAPEN